MEIIARAGKLITAGEYPAKVARIVRARMRRFAVLQQISAYMAEMEELLATMRREELAARLPEARFVAKALRALADEVPTSQIAAAHAAADAACEVFDMAWDAAQARTAAMWAAATELGTVWVPGAPWSPGGDTEDAATWAVSIAILHPMCAFVDAAEAASRGIAGDQVARILEDAGIW